MTFDAETLLNRPVGPEVSKTMKARRDSGFFDLYLSGADILDIGYRGNNPANQPIVPQAKGIERDYPGYDGKTLPFPDESQDAVHSSHCLEHIPDAGAALAEWFRVLRVGGYLVLTVPHQQLYERKPTPPSRWGGNEHLRFYTPAGLMSEVEAALPVGEFRLRSLRDNDSGFDYARAADQPPQGSYEIELVLQRIARPTYANNLRLSAPARAALGLYRQTIETLIGMDSAGLPLETPALEAFGRMLPIPPFRLLRALFPAEPELRLRKLIWPLVDANVVDPDYYLQIHPDVRRASGGDPGAAREHYRRAGYFEGKASSLKVGLYG